MEYNSNPLKFVIVGTGRCGTTLFQAMFNEAGIICGHENIFNSADDEVTRKRYINNTNYIAESSWAAAPYLDKFWFDDQIKIVHVVRDIFSVIKSFWEINFFSTERINKPLNDLVYKNTSICFETQDRLLSSIDHYFQWNRLIQIKLNAIKNPSIIIRIEDIQNDIKPLNDFLGIELSYIKKRFNMKEEEKSSSTEFDINLVKKIISERYGQYDFYNYL